MSPKAKLHPWEWREAPWYRIHIDYAGPINNDYFLIIVDAHSKWVDIYRTKGTSSQDTIMALSHSFSIFGLPISIVSYNTPGFVSVEFKEFLHNCVIRQITSAVYKPSSNGLAVRIVQAFKTLEKD